MSSARCLALLTLCVTAAGAGCWQVEVERGVDASRALRRGPPPSADELRRMVVRLRPLHGPADPPAPGDWLDRFHEPGQTFEQYLDGDPTRPAGPRRSIYLLPFGQLDAQRRRIVDATARYLSSYFCLPVKVGRPAPESSLARRRHPRWGIEQVDAEHLLDSVLEPRLPADATCLLGITAADLYPRRDWNYVYGYASHHRRVGAVSTYRMGTPVVGHAQSQRTALLRTLKIASHETAHMLSLRHCTRHRCNMGGMNYIGELDRRPMALCPECLAKVAWATGCDPVARYRELARFCRAHGLTAQAERYEALLRGLNGAR